AVDQQRLHQFEQVGVEVDLVGCVLLLWRGFHRARHRDRRRDIAVDDALAGGRAGGEREGQQDGDALHWRSSDRTSTISAREASQTSPTGFLAAICWARRSFTPAASSARLTASWPAFWRRSASAFHASMS